MKSNYLLFITTILVSQFSLLGNAEETKASLYQRLGGKRAISAVVDSFVNLAATDSKVNFTREGKFKGMDVPYLKGQLTDFISMATGGPVKYVGKDMKTAHTGMKIKSSEFDALANDLALTLDKFKVPATEKKELLTLVASTKNTIVEVNDAKALYDRLGGKRAIAAVVDSFVNLAATDTKVNFTRNGAFKGMDVPFLKGQLTDFISMATGGPVKYVGKDMKTAHAGMKIKSSEFDALANDLAITLDKFKVPSTEKQELLTLVASTKKTIVEVVDQQHPLYERLGGRPNLEVVVKSFVPLAAADKRVNFFRNGQFKNIDVQQLETHLVDFLVVATGGPKAYRGQDMKTVHSGMNITEDEFDAIAEDLSITLDKFKLPLKLKDELMGIVGSTKNDIVEINK